jgi:hypothetical protein
MEGGRLEMSLNAACNRTSWVNRPILLWIREIMLCEKSKTVNDVNDKIHLGKLSNAQ